MEGVGVRGPVLKAKPFPYHLGLFKRLRDSGLKGAQLAGAAEDPGRARGGGLGSRTPGDPPLPAGSRAEVLPRAPQLGVGTGHGSQPASLPVPALTWRPARRRRRAKIPFPTQLWEAVGGLPGIGPAQGARGPAVWAVGPRRGAVKAEGGRGGRRLGRSAGGRPPRAGARQGRDPRGCRRRGRAQLPRGRRGGDAAPALRDSGARPLESLHLAHVGTCRPAPCDLAPRSRCPPQPPPPGDVHLPESLRRGPGASRPNLVSSHPGLLPAAASAIRNVSPTIWPVL